MKINGDNYEQYFLDHAEGTLSPELERELLVFLEANPDLKSLLEDFDVSPLPSEEIKNNNLKKRLKKNIRPTIHIDEAHVDEWLIRDVEGLLSEAETGELNEFLAHNPAYKYDQKLFHLTKAEPDQTITFPGKNRLKKKAPVLIFTRMAWTVSAAAAVILLVIGIRFFNQPAVNESPQVIQTEANPVAELPASLPQLEAEKPAAAETKTAVEVTPAIQLAQFAGVARGPAFRLDPIEIAAVDLKTSYFTSNLNLVTYALSPVEIPEKEEKSLLAKVFGNMVGNARDAFRNNPSLDKIGDADINLWSIAEAGVRGFNTISDRDLELMVRRDEDGKIKSYALVEEDRLLLTRSLGEN